MTRGGARAGGAGERPDLRTALAGARGRRVAVVVEGQPLVAYDGESVAAVLLASGWRTFRHTDRDGEPRGYYCGMGVCHECLVTVDGLGGVRACMTPVRDGMRVERQPSLGVRDR